MIQKSRVDIIGYVGTYLGLGLRILEIVPVEHEDLDLELRVLFRHYFN